MPKPSPAMCMGGEGYCNRGACVSRDEAYVCTAYGNLRLNMTACPLTPSQPCVVHCALDADSWNLAEQLAMPSACRPKELPAQCYAMGHIDDGAPCSLIDASGQPSEGVCVGGVCARTPSSLICPSPPPSPSLPPLAPPSSPPSPPTLPPPPPSTPPCPLPPAPPGGYSPPPSFPAPSPSPAPPPPPVTVDPPPDFGPGAPPDGTPGSASPAPPPARPSRCSVRATAARLVGERSARRVAAAMVRPPGGGWLGCAYHKVDEAADLQGGTLCRRRRGASTQAACSCNRRRRVRFTLLTVAPRRSSVPEEARAHGRT